MLSTYFFPEKIKFEINLTGKIKCRMSVTNNIPAFLTGHTLFKKLIKVTKILVYSSAGFLLGFLKPDNYEMNVPQRIVTDTL